MSKFPTVAMLRRNLQSHNSCKEKKVLACMQSAPRVPASYATRPCISRQVLPQAWGPCISATCSLVFFGNQVREDLLPCVLP